MDFSRILARLGIKGATSSSGTEHAGKVPKLDSNGYIPNSLINPSTTITGTVGDFTVGDDLVVQGDLTVNGATTTISTTNLVIKDTSILLSDGATVGADASIQVERGVTGPNASILWDESEGVFKFGLAGAEVRPGEVTLAGDNTFTGINTFSHIVLGTPTSGTLTNCTGLPVGGVSGLGTGVATFLATPSSLNLKSAITDETGSGALVFATSPTLVTPALGTPSSGVLTNCTGLPVAGGGTGVATLTAYAPIFGGTTGTGAIQSGTVGTAGQVLTSNGAGVLPTFQNPTGASSAWLIKTANYTAVAGDKIQYNLSGAGIQLTLPASPSIGDHIDVEDAALNFDTYNLTILYTNSNKINGTTGNYTANVVGSKLSITYINSTIGWSIK